MHSIFDSVIIVSTLYAFQALHPPPLDAVIEAEHLLHVINALDRNNELTKLGRILAKMPLEPRLGKMIILGCNFL